MKREIILVLHSLAVGGAERRLSSVANYIAERGYPVTVLLLDNPVVKFEMHPAVRVVCVNQRPDLTEYDPAKCSLFQMERPVRTGLRDKLRLRLAHASGLKAADLAEKELYFRQTCAAPLEAYFRQRPEAVVASFMTVPNIVTMMAAWNLPNRVLFADTTDVATEYPPEHPFCVLRKKYYSRAQGALLQTPNQLEFYSFLPAVNKKVIPNFINSEQLPVPFVGVRKKEIVNFCRLSATKNLPLLIDAFSLLLKDYPDYMLSIIGDGEERDVLLNHITKLKLNQSVKILPFEKQIHDRILDSAMFVSSSDREGISNSMLEAMAIGLPCVCTDCAGGGARMMIEDHENGLLVPMRDVDALYKAMKEVIETPGLADKLSRNAVKIRERLRPDVICQQMLDAILGENE
ncbi:MAG: glycosyltransferase [Clostridia bacterium]|nr:glycosyltransferase [Clostridia bacterium]